jgi:hypothetical protein
MNTTFVIYLIPGISMNIYNTQTNFENIINGGSNPWRQPNDVKHTVSLQIKPAWFNDTCYMYSFMHCVIHVLEVKIIQNSHLIRNTSEKKSILRE